MCDWNAVKNEFLKTNISLRDLAEKYGISYSTLRKRAASEQWSEKRNRVGTITEQKMIEKTASQKAGKLDQLIRAG